MATAAAIAIIVGIFVAYFKYAGWLTRGIKPRTFETKLDPHQVRSIFVDRVAHTGWKIVDDGNPLVAQSSLAAGIRQQIGLTIRTENGQTMVHVGPHRWVTKRGIPKKAHTLRIRMNSFVDSVRAHDANIVVTLQELRAR
jgi:hypothetical protein